MFFLGVVSGSGEPVRSTMPFRFWGVEVNEYISSGLRFGVETAAFSRFVPFVVWFSFCRLNGDRFWESVLCFEDANSSGMVFCDCWELDGSGDGSGNEWAPLFSDWEFEPFI